ncbi:MAG: chaperone NapD [Candidatus Marinimicrobia bacterium]|nr:chaperone NapD [Candidatus Neomarinimicrobiota bacterium]MBL7109601.1 chaperone NapD [Candidatus Neomarinimicrobiota bacterium]
MAITGVVILVEPNKAEEILYEVSHLDDVTTYGLHKENNIVAVIEGENSKNLENKINQIKDKIDGILGIFPAYANYEEEIDE